LTREAAGRCIRINGERLGTAKDVNQQASAGPSRRLLFYWYSRLSPTERLILRLLRAADGRVFAAAAVRTTVVDYGERETSLGDIYDQH